MIPCLDLNHSDCDFTLYNEPMALASLRDLEVRTNCEIWGVGDDERLAGNISAVDLHTLSRIGIFGAPWVESSSRPCRKDDHCSELRRTWLNNVIYMLSVFAVHVYDILQVYLFRSEQRERLGLHGLVSLRRTGFIPTQQA